MRFDTRAIRVGQDPEPPFRPAVPPIYQTSTFVWDSLDAHVEFEYTRIQNPNRKALEEALASLEGGTRGFAFASGMSAIGATFSVLKSGDRLLLATDIYGGTDRYAKVELERQGIELGWFDARRPESIGEAATPNTKLVHFETPTNPNVRIVDLKAVADAAHSIGALCSIDNTFASPALQRPMEHGVDIVAHSTTKYVGGHSDLIGGAVVVRDDSVAERLKAWSDNLGPVPSPFDCWLALRGIRTLGCRMDHHCANAQKVAEFLEGHSKVARVHYPGLASHPDHALAAKQMAGFGGMVSFEVDGGAAEAKRVAESTRLFLLAESLGGVESLIGWPPAMSHAGLTEAERVERGIPPTLLRLSVGLEDADDLCEDLDQALSAG